MLKIDGNFTRWMFFGFIKDIFLSIFRALGALLGGAIAAGIIGAVGGFGVALFYGYPLVPWMIGGFVVCGIAAIVFMVFVANDMY